VSLLIADLSVFKIVQLSAYLKSTAWSEGIEFTQRLPNDDNYTVLVVMNSH